MKTETDHVPLLPPSRQPLDVEDRFRLEALERRIGYHFRDPFLARAALTHRSLAHLRGTPSYERLEFLGDAVLQLVVSEELYRGLPSAGPGELTHCRAETVCRDRLAAAAQTAGLTPCVAASGLAGGSIPPDSVAADALEAVLGAVYLDGGLEQTRVVIRLLLGQALAMAAAGDGVNWKARLQEFAQRHYGLLPEYRLEAERGAPHERAFRVRVHLGDLEFGVGEGRSKKAAEKAAARNACQGPLREFFPQGDR